MTIELPGYRVASNLTARGGARPGARSGARLAGYRPDEVDPERVQTALGLAVQHAELTGPDQHAHRDQHGAAGEDDHAVVALDPAEQPRHAIERERGRDERDRQAGGVEGQQQRAVALRARGSGGGEDRPERRARARRPGDREAPRRRPAGRRARRGRSAARHATRGRAPASAPRARTARRARRSGRPRRDRASPCSRSAPRRSPSRPARAG